MRDVTDGPGDIRLDASVGRPTPVGDTGLNGTLDAADVSWLAQCVLAMVVPNNGRLLGC